ncbi:MAG: AAA family ATPase [Candidatus Odinarchaeum yellowstonii]|uniref:AAA family ATPase n=1 Tax=Odinarchaeota yellowstonii (strain LCB_4) TaxID=1841599 RepID=A0AAF0D2M0_ODILC|nr:MAG: AAA family ATPase [Candidatus Odinarchaeum yellowstonii]
MDVLDITILEIAVLIAILVPYMYIAARTIEFNKRKPIFVWSRSETIAVLIRYLFFSALLSFLTYSMIMIAIVLIDALLPLNPASYIPLTIPVLSLLLFFFTGIIYAAYKLKHIYEIIDEQVYDFTPWWVAHPKSARILSPLIYLSTPEYRRWLAAQLTPRKKRKILASLELDLPKSKEHLVGREKEFRFIMSSILYHVVRDPQFRKVFKGDPPPKFFLIKGMTGTGKTLLAEVCMREAVVEGLKASVNVQVRGVKSSDVFNPYYGESARNLNQIFKSAVNVPSVLFFDEFDSFAKHVSRHDTQMAQIEDLRVQSTFIEGLKKVLDTEARVVVIAATNSFESVRDDIRRRAYFVDLDQNITREMLEAVLHAELIKNGWDYLDEKQIMDTLEKAVSVYRQTQLTPFDIIDAVQKVRNMKVEPLREKLFTSSVKSAKPLTYEVTLEDFKLAARGLRGYLEKEKSTEVLSSVLKIKPTVTYDDVGGLIGIKEKIFKSISLSLHPEIGTKLGWVPPKGYILWGEPGCGKTHISKAIAKENSATFFYAPAAQLLINAKWVGEPEKNVRDLFDYARKESPSIIFFDEFDIIAGRRKGDPVGDKITAQILTELDGLQPLENVIVIAATNKLEAIDEAVLNRFEPNIIEIPLPRNDEERISIIKIHLNNYLQHLDEEVTVESVLKIFKRHRIVSPRVMAEVIKEANRLRSQEIFAAWEFTNKVPGAYYSPEIFKEDLERLKKVIELIKEKTGNNLRIEDVTPENYKVKLFHFEQAANILEQEVDAEIIDAQESVIPSEPQIGVAYGLGTDPSGRKGVILMVECNIHRNGTGKLIVTGAAKTLLVTPQTPVKDESVIESATNVIEYIKKYIYENIGVDISGYDFTFQIISPLEGAAGMGVSGPSLGAALSLSAISELSKIPVASDTVLTGKADIKGNIGPVGGTGWRGTGKFLAAIKTKKVHVKKFLIPEWNYQTSIDEIEILREKNIEIIPVKTQIHAWLSALNVDEKILVEKLKDALAVN